MVRTSTGQTRINFHIQDGVLAALKHMARIRGTSYSDLIRIACREYVLKNAQAAVNEAKAIEAVTPEVKQ